MLTWLRRGQCRYWDETDFRKKLRQLSLPRRVSLFALIAFFFLYFIIAKLTSSPNASRAKLCISDRVQLWKLMAKSYMVDINDKQFIFAGNGFIGLGGDGELRLKSPTSRVLNLRTSFNPLIIANIRYSSSQSHAFVTDFRDGTAGSTHCFAFGESCVTVLQKVYAHRTRPHVLVQVIQVINPTDSAVTVILTSKENDAWKKGESIGDTYVFTRTMDADGSRLLVAEVCSSIQSTIKVERKEEKNIRFICIINYDTLADNANEIDEFKKLSDSVVKEFSDTLAGASASLDREHELAWKALNEVTFGISYSLAPEALNPDEINATRYMILSNLRDPLSEYGVSDEVRKAASISLHDVDMCYTGHSTLLVPSRLWRKTSNMNEMVETMEIWLLTLEKRGCANILKAGARGFAQAYALSLFACKFTHEHLEVGIDPADLHREITVKDLSLSFEANISISINLDNENRPYLMVSSSSEAFVCNAACNDAPIVIGKTPTYVPVKITRPLTSILYVSHNKEHLEQLRGTIHIIEVVDAPANEHSLIALHKHGHRLGGLPVIFWFMLGALVLAFHLFLVKLVYTEWKKGDFIPYNHYLQQRYLRTH